MSRQNRHHQSCRELHVVVLGAAQFVHNEWIESYDPTIEDTYRTQLQVDGRQVVLEILDTAGTEQFVAMRDLYMKSGQGFILVFSITSSSSMTEIEMLREEITRIKDDDNVPIVIVGNKADLEEQRSVPRQRAFACSQMWDAPYYETSARTRTNVDAVFIDICRQLLMKDEKFQSQAAAHEDDEHEYEKNPGLMGFAKRKNRRRRRPDGHRCVIL
ncbi:ras family protein [Colletotrichum tofieldiae]|nr:Ras family protein [Colletotrichum tofieldiae]GKT69564.1 ras family protein [Colletotrichum tofieldiae]GKT96122.1 ras family protein [Colletotrichum tofieldiae]